jgi:hypothetical protein
VKEPVFWEWATGPLFLLAPFRNLGTTNDG